jgi:hypothetical protein
MGNCDVRPLVLSWRVVMQLGSDNQATATPFGASRKACCAAGSWLEASLAATPTMLAMGI